MQPALDCTYRYPRQLGHFPQRQAINQGQHHDFLVPRTQFFERFLDIHPLFHAASLINLVADHILRH